MNSDYKLIDDILTIGQHFTLNRTSEVQAPGGIIETALDIPSAIPVYASDGSWGGPVGGWPDRRNLVPYLNTIKTTDTLTGVCLGDAYVNLTPFKGFNLRSTFGLDYANKLRHVTSLILIRKERRQIMARAQWKPSRNTGRNGCGTPLLPTNWK